MPTTNENGGAKTGIKLEGSEAELMRCADSLVRSAKALYQEFETQILRLTESKLVCSKLLAQVTSDMHQLAGEMGKRHGLAEEDLANGRYSLDLKTMVFTRTG